MATDLKDFVGPLKAADDIAFAEECATQADALVTDFLAGSHVVRQIPADVKARAVLEVGAELYHRRNAKNGVMQLATPDQPATRIARDPMVAAYPILNRYVLGGVS